MLHIPVILPRFLLNNLLVICLFNFSVSSQFHVLSVSHQALSSSVSMLKLLALPLHLPSSWFLSSVTHFGWSDQFDWGPKFQRCFIFIFLSCCFPTALSQMNQTFWATCLPSCLWWHCNKEHILLLQLGILPVLCKKWHYIWVILGLLCCHGQIWEKNTL